MLLTGLEHRGECEAQEHGALQEQTWRMRRPPRVVLAEDQVSMRALMARMLRRQGYEVHEAGDGMALLETLARVLLAPGAAGMPDLVITDVRMPGCTGLEVLARMRRDEWPTPVVLISAFGDEALHAAARRLGAHVLDKPFELEALSALAQRLAPAP
jgi:two-component system, response regulator, stage 0 sporulation protein F